MDIFNRTMKGVLIMGILYDVARFLICCSPASSAAIEKVDFSRTITLGRQVIYKSQQIDFAELFRRYFGNEPASGKYKDFLNTINKNSCIEKYADEFFHLLGATELDSCDYSDYEGATIIHDMQVPIPADLKNKYTCVFDGGLLEHVYNFPIAMKNAMGMVSIGGHLVLSTPGNNFFGHGFYQFSPELFYSVLVEENGFTNTRIYCNDGDKWYLIKNPREILSRTEVSPYWQDALLYVVSKKIADTPDDFTAYQSDYESIWGKEYSPPSKYSNIELLAIRFLPPLYVRF